MEPGETLGIAAQIAVALAGFAIHPGVNPDFRGCDLSPYWNALRSVGISYDYAFGINLNHPI